MAGETGAGQGSAEERLEGGETDADDTVKGRGTD